MSERRTGLRFGALAATVVLAATSACNSQSQLETRESMPMSNPPQASRPPAPSVEPIVHKGVRYEEDRVDASKGDRNGGYLAAIDAETGEKLWRLQVYEVPDHSAQGLPNIGRYFRSMRLVPGRDELEIENEAGGRYLVDLVNRTSTHLPSSAPEKRQDEDAPAKPKPK